MTATGSTGIAATRPLGAVYSRNSTGLVRDLNAFDAFNLCFSAVAVPIGITQAFLFAPALFPGINMVWSFVVATVMAFFFGLVYLYFTQWMPRAGGDYVWVSRILHPSLGFVVGAVATFTPLSFAAIVLGIMPPIYLPALMRLMGNDHFTLTQGPQFMLSCAASLLIGAVMVLGLRWLARITGLLFAFVMAGFVLWLGLLLFASPSTFVHNLNAHSTQSYGAIINVAHSNGLTSSVDVKSTLLGVVYGFQFFVGFQWVAYFAGEVRNAAKTARIAIIGVWATTAVSFIAASVVMYRYYGWDFLSSSVYVFTNQAKQYNLPIPPYNSSFIEFTTGNGFLQYFIVLSMLAALLWQSFAGFLVTTRNLFAWSFDRLVPARLSDVSDRF